MAHLGSIRKGWESEHLAKFILSKFCFIANPTTIADDVGSDFFCTIFQVAKVEGHEYLIPRNSFAIQVKSTAESVDVSEKLEYLLDLEMPFLLGVVDRSELTLTLYSGEYLPILFSGVGKPTKLELQPVKETELPGDHYVENPSDRGFILKCPKIVEISATVAKEELSTKSEVIRNRCMAIQENIASRTSKESVFTVGNPPLVVISAGQGSVQVFRENFLKRLAEVFFNLLWIRMNYPERFGIDEFRTYEEIYAHVKNQYGTLPGHLMEPYERLKKEVES